MRLHVSSILFSLSRHIDDGFFTFPHSDAVRVLFVERRRTTIREEKSGTASQQALLGKIKGIQQSTHDGTLFLLAGVSVFFRVLFAMLY